MSDTPEETLLSEAPLSPATAEASQPYVGEWNQLVSTTNWEKGRIICAWRGALVDDGAEPSEYSDETWARLVGGVTGQHVGRLRRVSQRFGSKFTDFRGLYWSHFQAAIDWDDAEMWLEGALQSDWSVAQMRKQRWETLGAVPDDQPQAEDEVRSELDEDFEPAQREDPLTPEYTEIAAGPRHEGPDFGDEERASADGDSDLEDDAEYADAGQESAMPIERVRPFEGLPELPDDVLDAVERFKLIILKHRREGWSDVAQSDVVSALAALQQLALAPAEEVAPF
jgi:hypothetical protein